MTHKPQYYEDLRLMVQSDFFTFDYWFQNIIKYHSDPKAMAIFIDRLRTYPILDIEPFFSELVFFSLHYNCKLIDSYLLDLCANQFKYFYKISSLFEIWGQQFMVQGNVQKNRVRNLLEDCETYLVNGEKVSNSSSDGGKEEKASKPTDPKILLELVNLKNAKNDLKDDVRSFVGYLVKLAYFLMSESREKSKEIACAHLHKMNLELFKRRLGSTETWRSVGFSLAVELPFETDPNSSLIVRILHSEVKIFGTRERVPFLIFFETVSEEDIRTLTPDWNKDFDYLRWKYDIPFPEKIQDVKKVSLKDSQMILKELQKFEAEQKNLLKKIETIDQSKFKPRGESKSEEIRRKKKGKIKNKEQFADKKLSRMTEKEIHAKIEFILMLLRHSSAKTIARMNIEQLEKLKQALAAIRHKKQESDLRTNEFTAKCMAIKRDSPFEKFPSYNLRAFIVKAGDDMRQESFLIHLISLVRNYLRKEDAVIYICNLDFILLSKTAAMIEFLPNSHSIDSLKKIYKEKSLYNIFRILFSKNFEEAQKNFVASLAGYSFVCYLFNIKDRHNGNIMIGPQGHIVHIDFGFSFNSTPGNISFETAPFKLTQDYLDIMGGETSPLFYFFKMLIVRCFNGIKKYADIIWTSVEIMMNSDLGCFVKFDMKGFKDRFLRSMSDLEKERFVDGLVQTSIKSTRTSIYDKFQKYTNDIEI